MKRRRLRRGEKVRKEREKAEVRKVSIFLLIVVKDTAEAAHQREKEVREKREVCADNKTREAFRRQVTKELNFMWSNRRDRTLDPWECFDLSKELRRKKI